MNEELTMIPRFPRAVNDDINDTNGRNEKRPTLTSGERLL